MKYKNIKEATENWVNGFNAIPQGLIVKAYGGDNIDDIREVTKPSVGDIVYSNEHQGEYEVVRIEDDKAILKDFISDDEPIEDDIDNIYIEHDSFLPMWGTLWTFGDSADEYWLDKDENLQKMSDAGFRIFETDELGYLFGIDGAGYDFYENHWIPLYKARGLRWHSEEK